MVNVIMVSTANKITFFSHKKHENRLKKGYMEMSKNFYLETKKSVLGSSINHYF